MSKGFYQNIKRADSQHLPADPRFPIARHIGWTRSNLPETEFTIPEPDAYNRAVLAERPLECNFIKNSIFYRDETTTNWWTVYLVPKEQELEFEVWIREQPYKIFWWHPKPAAIRRRKSMLCQRKNLAELTAEERLYTMGYYAKLSQQHFSDNDNILLERLGPVRDIVLNEELW